MPGWDESGSPGGPGWRSTRDGGGRPGLGLTRAVGESGRRLSPAVAATWEVARAGRPLLSRAAGPPVTWAGAPAWARAGLRAPPAAGSPRRWPPRGRSPGPGRWPCRGRRLGGRGRRTAARDGEEARRPFLALAVGRADLGLAVGRADLGLRQRQQQRMRLRQRLRLRPQLRLRGHPQRRPAPGWAARRGRGRRRPGTGVGEAGGAQDGRRTQAAGGARVAVAPARPPLVALPWSRRPPPNAQDQGACLRARCFAHDL